MRTGAKFTPSGFLALEYTRANVEESERHNDQEPRERPEKTGGNGITTPARAHRGPQESILALPELTTEFGTVSNSARRHAKRGRKVKKATRAGSDPAQISPATRQKRRITDPAGPLPLVIIGIMLIWARVCRCALGRKCTEKGPQLFQ